MGREILQWRRGYALALAGRFVASVLQQRSWHSHGWTPGAARMLNQAKTGRSTWHAISGSGTSPGTPATSAKDAASWSDKTMTVSDVMHAPYAVLGTREHAISLLSGMVAALGENRDQLCMNGYEHEGQQLSHLGANCLDIIDLFLGLEEMA